MDENGNVEKFFIKTTELWEVPGDVVYNSVLDRFVVAWFAGAEPRLGLVNPHTGEFERVLSDDRITTPRLRSVGDGFNALATRTRLGNPQAFVYWREGHGLSGAHGTIVDLNSGTEIPVTGGGIPCTDIPQQTLLPSAPLPPVEEIESEETFFPPTPEPTPELRVEKFVRNVTEGQTASREAIRDVHPTDIIQFITLITSQTDRTISGLVVHDHLPDAMDFRNGSTLIDGASTLGHEVVEDGLHIGSIEPGETRTVRWSGQVRDIAALAGGVNSLELPVIVTTDDAGTFFSDALWSCRTRM